MKTYFVQSKAGKAWFRTHDLAEARGIEKDLLSYRHHRGDIHIVDEAGKVIDKDFVEPSADPKRRLRALNVLFDYDVSARLADLYDSNPELRAAVIDLIGPTFEYPDWAHQTMMSVIKQGVRVKQTEPDWLAEMIERRVAAGYDEERSRVALLGLIFGNNGNQGDWSGWLVLEGFADRPRAQEVVKLIVSAEAEELTPCH
ncbi:hypothetical protein [Burkholderia gladioli]|uniref:hypothetical protein n=1 Tax=Burkholderia gladioli TaxID=28095 RepID=UPI001640F5D9|nr:hypothetical protein [Burkholderia gladioli]